MPTWQVEMLWDCEDCRTKGIGGSKKRCPNCGAAQTPQERWYMPGDTSERAAVKDPEKLRDALAGPDCACDFCGGTQRRRDGNCANCGATPGGKPHIQDFCDRVLRARRDPDWSPSTVDVPAGSTAWPHDIPLMNALVDPVQRHTQGPLPVRLWPFRLLDGARDHWPLIAAGAATILLLAIASWWFFHTREFEAVVQSVAWSHEVHVDRYLVVADDGFDEDRPADAFDVRSIGMRHHHYRQVLDHYETEHYTERVACGEECHTTPEHCSSNANGYATCTGGDQVCSTKYCNEDRTRQVPVYRDESVTEMYYAWKAWRWRPNRVVKDGGTTTATTWPSEERVCLGGSTATGRCVLGLPPGEKERAERRTSYTSVFVDPEDPGDTYPYHPKALEEFVRLPPGARQQVSYSVAGGVSIVPAEEIP